VLTARRRCCSEIRGVDHSANVRGGGRWSFWRGFEEVDVEVEVVEVDSM
jgi:hypothetical protein